tara:strand:- start:459 stop:935 length:477 start_codon:yes stop_codon:yes gene_type:complete
MQNFFDMNKNTLATLALIAIISYGCSKYDDGPAFSLRTKKGRLSGEWELDKINGQDPDDYYSNSWSVYNNVEITWTFERDGDFEACMDAEVQYGYSNYSYSYSYSDCDDGDWEFEDNGEELELQMNGSSYNQTYEINRLSSNELWLEMGSDEWEFKKN